MIIIVKNILLFVHSSAIYGGLKSVREETISGSVTDGYKNQHSDTLGHVMLII